MHSSPQDRPIIHNNRLATSRHQKSMEAYSILFYSILKSQIYGDVSAGAQQGHLTVS